MECLLFHDWGKWEQYDIPCIIIPGLLYSKELRSKTFESKEFRQKRKCLKCGKVQDEEIRAS